MNKNTSSENISILNNKFEFVLMVFVFSIAVTLLLGVEHSYAMSMSYPYIIIAMLLWPTFRFELVESYCIIFIISSITIFYTISFTGAFYNGDLSSSLLVLQIFLSVISSIVLVICCTVKEKIKDTEEELEKNYSLLIACIQQSEAGIVIANCKTNEYILANATAKKIFF